MSKKIWFSYVNFIRPFIVLLICSVMFMQNEVFIGKVFADDDGTRPDAGRLKGCEKVAQGDTEGISGDKCTLKTAEFGDQALVMTEQYISTIITWVAALMSILQVKRCIQPQISCGLSTMMSALAGLALLAGEIVQIAMYSDNQDKIEYRPDMLRKYKAQCDGSGSGGAVGSDVGAITDANGQNARSICDQYSALVSQKKSYEKAKQAAEIKMSLQIAAAVAYALAAIVEYYGAITNNSTITTLLTSAAAFQVAITEPAFCGKEVVAAGECAARVAACTPPLINSISALTLEQEENLSLVFFTPSQTITTAIQEYIGTSDKTLNACNVVEGGAAYVSAFKAHYQVINCPQFISCVYGKQSLGLTYNGALESPYHYVWQNFYFNPAQDKLFNLEGDSELLVQSMSHMETETIFSGEGQSPSLTNYLYLKHLESNNVITAKELNTIQHVTDLLMSSAAAGNTSMSNVNNIITSALGLTAVAVTVVVALTSVMNKFADMMYATPLKRGLWNTLTAVLAGGLAIMTKYMVIDVLQKNINSIQAILDAADTSNLKVNTAPTKTIPYNEVPVDVDGLKGTPIIPASNPPLPCPAGGDGKGGCKDVGNDVASTLGSLNLGGLSGLSKSIVSLGKELGNSRTVSPNAMKATTNLSANATRVQKLLKNVKDLYNKNRVKNKQAPVNFDKVEKEIMKGLYSKAKDTLKANNATAESVLGSARTQGANNEEAKKKLNDFAQESVKRQNVAGASSATVAVDPLASFELQGQAEAEGQGQSQINPGTEGEVPIDSALNVNTNDILNDPNVSIFELLTARYLKSYPRLFEEQK